MSQEYSLQTVAAFLGAVIQGDPQVKVNQLATLRSADNRSISFLANPVYKDQLPLTAAAAVIISPSMSSLCTTNAIVTNNPYLGYARISHWFNHKFAKSKVIDTKVLIAGSARIHDSATIAPCSVIGENTIIGKNVSIGAGSVIGNNCVIAADSMLAANVTLYDDIKIGQRVIIHSGVIIGADGFGFARDDKARWIKVAQIGGVKIEDDVEIGAGTTIDCGAIDDTLIGKGVKLDNQVQIAHNVTIGENTIIAGCTAIAGSTTIGKSCLIAGGVGIAGHLTIADNVRVTTAMSLVNHSLLEPTDYSSGILIDDSFSWKKNALRFQQLDKIARRLKKLEQIVNDRHQD